VANGDKRKILPPPTSWALTIRGEELLAKTGRGGVQSVRRAGMSFPLNKCVLENKSNDKVDS
jgi:hypothetical protein